MPTKPAANPPERRGSTSTFVIGLLCVFSMAVPARIAAKAGPARVVSLNLCTDQLALALLPRERIVALSFLAADPGLSALSDRVGDIPLVQGMAEEVLPLVPDLVLAGTFTTRPTIALLRARGVTVLEVGLVSDFDGIRAQIRQVAAALDVAARGEELIAGMDATLAAAAPTGPARPARVLSLAPGAFTAGSGTLSDAVMRAAGLVNYAADKGLQGYGYLPVETVAADPPDLLVANADEQGYPSLNGQMLAHPALDRAVPAQDRPAVPGRLWTCGGPFTADAATMLAAARDRLLSRKD
ncbi:ABC transporter substrate-binding protein [Niveispirillum sp. KHB5.9]|uniref:ABC transporter substrate-binding protein n=1 Tax=Niveispirillum sp. KHB5.9 TaxID=3400269 RepID=UPI003A83A030